MGLKYIEQVKSVILLLLILFSLTLTFSIWTYSPTVDTNEAAPIVDIAIAEKKKIEDVIKPYRLLVSQDNNLYGSIATQDIDGVLSLMKNWEVQTVELLTRHASMTQLNEYVNAPNRITLFFQAEVPIKTYSSVLNFVEQDFTNPSFNRLIIDWSEISSNEMKMYFINTTSKKVYSASIKKFNEGNSIKNIVKEATSFSLYNEIVREDKLSLYVSTSPEETVRYTYLIKEIPPVKFKNALFRNPSLVRSNTLGTSEQQFTDDATLMNVNSSYHRISFVNPAAESEKGKELGELIQRSVNFVNEHDGWTDDYRYSSNPSSQQIRYQLHFFGLPVFSHDTETEIIQYWGDNDVYRYTRPYFTLNAIPFNQRDVSLLSGQDIYDLLATFPDIELSSINDIMPGYKLSRDDDQSTLTLEPFWYYSMGGSWIRVSTELRGGDEFGLE